MEKQFTIEVTMEERWIPHFMSMLNYMERLGNIGSSRNVGLYVDGDGDFRPKFKTDVTWEEESPVSDDNGDRIYDAG